MPAYDKVAWQYAFEFEGVLCRLRWTKSGVKLTVWMPEGSRSANAVSAEIERRLMSAAQRVYQIAVSPEVKRQQGLNCVVVVNQYSRYRGMVDYFLDQLSKNRADGPPAVEVESDGQDDTAISAVVGGVRQAQGDAQHRRELGYLATALLAAYFAYIHHALVILAAFSPRALQEDFSLMELLGARWAGQFDVAYPPPHAGDVGRAKSDLRHIAAQYRNPLLHGGGGRPSDGMFVEWAPGRWTLVSETGEPTDQFMLWQPALSETEIDDILARINRIDDSLAVHPFFPGQGWRATSDRKLSGAHFLHLSEAKSTHSQLQPTAPSMTRLTGIDS